MLQAEARRLIRVILLVVRNSTELSSELVAALGAAGKLAHGGDVRGAFVSNDDVPNSGGCHDFHGHKVPIIVRNVGLSLSCRGRENLAAACLYLGGCCLIRDELAQVDHVLGG